MSEEQSTGTSTPRASFTDLPPHVQDSLREHGYDFVLGMFASFEARVDANTEAFRELRRDNDARFDSLDAGLRKLSDDQAQILRMLAAHGVASTELAAQVARASLNDAEEAKPADDSDPPPPEVDKWLRVLPRDQRAKARAAIGYLVLAVLALVLAIVTKLGGDW